MGTKNKTLLDRLWDLHVIKSLGGGTDLLHIDRHFVHDLCAPCFNDIDAKGRSIRNPELVLATIDHTVSTLPGRNGKAVPGGQALADDIRRASQKWGIKFFDIGRQGNGIVHVMGPELGLTLPGTTIVCGDSHTCTQGALGALAFGIGSSEIVHVLATQALVQRRPRAMRVIFQGKRGLGVQVKDIALALIGKIGADGGDGYAIEYAGPFIDEATIDERMTLCNLSVESGAKIGFIAPDDKTFKYLQNRSYAPKGEVWNKAIEHWETLRSDDDARFAKEVFVDVADVAPQITWGTSPQDTIPVDAVIPDPDSAPSAERRKAMIAALKYMGLEPNKPIAGTPVDRVFIGSCTNGRLSDLRAAASVIRSHGKVAEHVQAWAVPGSEQVKHDAEAEGLDKVFKAAGFLWREPGCSMCLAANGELVSPGQRVVSTSNRNFVGRQGPGARTHLASPVMAAAAALRGCITDVRTFGD